MILLANSDFEYFSYIVVDNDSEMFSVASVMVIFFNLNSSVLARFLNELLD